MHFIDGHCHILPGVDDGSQTLKYSIEMLKRAKEIGVDTIICTPHIKEEYNDLDLIKTAFERLNIYADRFGIRLILGYEIHWESIDSSYFEDLEGCTLGDSNLFLLEFSLGHVPQNWRLLTYKLQVLGLQVIIAHPERYQSVQHDISLIEQFKDEGCLLMSSGNFLDKKFCRNHGAHKKVVNKMLKLGALDLIGTDAHSLDYYDQYISAVNYSVKHGYNPVRANKILSVAF